MNQGRAHVGTATILTIFMVLCLSAFGMLSVVSAQADLKLSRKTGEMVQGYYAADAQGEQALARADALLQQAWEQTAGLAGQERETAFLRSAGELLRSGEEFELSDGGEGLVISWSEPAGEGQTLEISVQVTPQGEWDIQRWQVVRTEAEEDESYGIDLWDGAV